MSRFRLDSLFEKKIVEIVNRWGGDSESMIEAIKQCFIDNEINDTFFKTHTKRDFTQLLANYGIKIGKAVKLWKAFANDNYSGNVSNEPQMNHNNDGYINISTENKQNNDVDHVTHYEDQRLSPPPWANNIDTINDTKQDEQENNVFPLPPPDISLPTPSLLYSLHPTSHKNGIYVSYTNMNQGLNSSLREIVYPLSISMEASFVLYLIFLYRLYVVMGDL